MLGFPILYFKGMRLMMFQLSGFYYKGSIAGFYNIGALILLAVNSTFQLLGFS